MYFLTLCWKFLALLLSCTIGQRYPGLETSIWYWVVYQYFSWEGSVSTFSENFDGRDVSERIFNHVTTRNLVEMTWNIKGTPSLWKMVSFKKRKNKNKCHKIMSYKKKKKLISAKKSCFSYDNVHLFIQTL